jgi:hypothetical protein
VPSRSRTPAEAVEHYRSQTARLLSCITNAHVVVSGYHVGAAQHRLALADSDPVRLRGEQHLSLDVAEHYRVRDTGDGWWVEVVAYSYILEQDGRELIVYHWHPRGRSSITGPHLHVRADIDIGDRWLGKVHLPTGLIRLTDIVGLAVEDLGAQPLREDWERLIDEARSSLKRTR